LIRHLLHGDRLGPCKKPKHKDKVDHRDARRGEGDPWRGGEGPRYARRWRDD
jgi:hypothetical protein